ncbi:MAG: hypothetical protein Kow0080_09260 [Candidatus Promineifilaceae bacterium]
MLSSTHILEEKPAAIQQRTNLSELQFLYWVGQKLRPYSPIFNNIFTFTIPAAVNFDDFSRAFYRVVQASDALRTAVTEEAGIPQQQVQEGIPTPMVFVDLSTEPNPMEALQDWLNAVSQRPFTLDHCLYHTALIQTSPDTTIWYLNQHHLITDATSIFLIVEHTLRGYEAMQQGEPLPPLTLPTFASHLEGVKKLQQSSRALKAQQFWVERLSQPLPALSFYGRTRLHPQTAVTRHTIQLTPAQTAAFQQAAVTLQPNISSDQAHFQALAALLFAYLHHATGQTRLGIVTTIHNRPTAVSRQTIGVLMALVPLIITLQPEESFSQLTARIQEEMKQLLIHYRCGLGEALQNHAFDVMLNLNFRPALTVAGHPITQQIIHPRCGSEKLALHVHYLAENQRYELLFDFNDDLFTPEEQQHTIQSFLALLAAFVEEPTRPFRHSLLPWPETAVTLPADSPQTAPPYTPPGTHTERILQAIWQGILEQPRIGIHDNFFDLGGESWQAMSLLLQIEKKTGCTLPVDVLLTSGTIAQMAALIDRFQDKPDEAKDWVVIQKGDMGKRPLFFIPGAAGNTLVAGRIAPHLAPDQPFYACTMPGIGNKKKPHLTIPELAAHYVQAIKKAQPTGPYALCGYSAGGIIALEMAQQLQAKGETVASLIVLDIPIQGPNMAFLRRLSQRIGQWRGLNAEQETAQFIAWRNTVIATGHYLFYRLWRVTLPDLARRLTQRLSPVTKGKWAVTETAVTPAERARIIAEFTSEQLENPQTKQIYQLTDKAARSYIAKPYNGPITLLRCTRRSGPANMRPYSYHQGWQQITNQIETRVLSAPGHLPLVHEPYVQELAAAIQEIVNNS